MARCTEDQTESDDKTGPEDFVELKEAQEIRNVVGAEGFGDVETEHSTAGNKADSEEDWDDLPVTAPVNLILAGIDNLTQSLHIAQIGLDNMKKGYVMIQKDLMKHVDS